MGCRGSKPVETIHSDNINTVFKLEDKSLTVADQIKNSRKPKNRTNKYDPKIIAKYEIKAELGKGKFTKVLRVENKMSRSPYALKILVKMEGLETFENEISILRRITHRQVIKLIEVFVSENKKGSTTTAVVLELTTGGDLFDRLFATGPFSERDAAKVVSQVLSGVAYLHSIGITHRDLKPNNLLYYQPGKESKVLITDFGMAHTRRSIDDVLMRDVCGTPEYLAPEVVARQPYTQAVDLWALGIVTYIILQAKFPFPLSDDRMQLFRAIARAEYNLDDQDWRNRSPECQSFVLCLLSKDGASRPSAADALQLPWLLARLPHTSSGHWPKGERSGSSASSASSVRSLQQLRSAVSVRLPASDWGTATRETGTRYQRGTRTNPRRQSFKKRRKKPHPMPLTG